MKKNYNYQATYIIAGLLLTLTGCSELFGYSFEHNPKDEEETFLSAEEGGCEVEVVELSSFFNEDRELSADRPPEGSLITLEGRPQSNMICTMLGCNWECCNNSCGYMTGCAYSLNVDSYNKICLSHESFSCGGTDCSPWCSPFSSNPQHDYRFYGSVSYEDNWPTLEVERICVVETP